MSSSQELFTLVQEDQIKQSRLEQLSNLNSEHSGRLQDQEQEHKEGHAVSHMHITASDSPSALENQGACIASNEGVVKNFKPQPDNTTLQRGNDSEQKAADGHSAQPQSNLGPSSSVMMAPINECAHKQLPITAASEIASLRQREAAASGQAGERPMSELVKELELIGTKIIQMLEEREQMRRDLEAAGLSGVYEGRFPSSCAWQES